ncbi:MAG: RtcB family protein [Myxococcales bacterium]
MPRLIATKHVPIAVWASDPPPAAMRQLQAIAELPFVVERAAGMPDLHVAEGVAVGTVFATERELVPAALGSDLGCGMAAVRFAFPAASLSRQDLEDLLQSFAKAFSGKAKAELGPEAEACLTGRLSTRALEHQRERVGRGQLGTVGGGNHFVELDRDMEGHLWLLVHSGSRGIGGAIGAHHAKAAKAASGSKSELGFLDASTDAGRGFLLDLAWGLQYARANRSRLVELASKVLAERHGAMAAAETRIDLPHNFIAEEVVDGRSLLVHRKGAAPAASGSLGLIPGSMGTASYLVEGLGNPSSFGSCSHGAGRVMSRTEARQRIGAKDLERSMRKVVYDERLARALVEEAPGAYRDIGTVLEEQADLVRPVMRLEPLAVYKGR